MTNNLRSPFGQNSVCQPNGCWPVRLCGHKYTMHWGAFVMNILEKTLEKDECDATKKEGQCHSTRES